MHTKIYTKYGIRGGASNMILIESICCLFPKNSCYLLKLGLVLFFIYLYYFALRLILSDISSLIISIKDSKIKLKPDDESKENGSEKFGIPSCADYRYRSFYFGLRPYFQHIFEISEKDIKNYEKTPQKIKDKEEKQKFIKFYMAELLCYRYFSIRKIYNFFFPWISYKTLSLKQIIKIQKQVEDLIK